MVKLSRRGKAPPHIPRQSRCQDRCLLIGEGIGWPEPRLYKRFVLVRANYPNAGESALVIADIDGSNEQTLVVRKRPERFSPIFFTGPSWSPDGKLIAATVATAAATFNIVVFSVDNGAARVLTRQPWNFAARAQWLPDMSGLLVVAGDTVSSAQHWMLGYPGGETRRITNDLGTYRAIGLTADGVKVTTVQADGLVNVWVAPEADATRAVRLPTGNFGFYSTGGNHLNWTPDNRLVYASNEGGKPDIGIADPNGENRKQLSTIGGAAPVVTSDGR